MNYQFDSIEDAINEVKNGRLIIVLDSKDREYEGDFIGAAAKVTPETINFMLKYARGAFIATFMPPGICSKLKIPPMSVGNTSFNKTNFRVSVDAKSAITGSSAFDRAKTVNLLAGPQSKHEDFVIPGHVIPIEATQKGLFGRGGHTEAGVALVKLAGFDPAVAIDLEILNEDGTMAHEEHLFYLAKKFQLKIINIDSLLKFLKES